MSRRIPTRVDNFLLNINDLVCECLYIAIGGEKDIQTKFNDLSKNLRKEPICVKVRKGVDM